jgi:protein-disulfide isomerase
VRGSLDAPVVITEFADFECPYCGDAYPVLEDVLKKYGQRVALVFRHFPLPMHPHAPAAAEAAEAAAADGKFWEMYAQLFRHQRALTNANLASYAKTLGIEPSGVIQAIEHETYRARIERDVQSGTESNIEGTPSIFVNGYAFEDDVSLDALSETIDDALAAAS